MRAAVVEGTNGFNREGCRSAFKCAEIESSIVARDNRKKSRRAVVLKQNCGVRLGCVERSDMVGSRGSGDLGLEGAEGRDQNMDATMSNAFHLPAMVTLYGFSAWLCF